MKIEYTEPDEAQVIELLGYLPVFEAPNFRCGELKSEPGVIPQAVYTEIAARFIRDCAATGLLLMKPSGSPRTKIPAAWDDLAAKMKNQPELFDTASLEELRIYLTIVLQFESFWPVAMYLEFTNGRIVRMLRRFQQIIDA